MSHLPILNLEEDFNKIEIFVESICDELKLHETFHGNMLIAITEVIRYVEAHSIGGELNCIRKPGKLVYEYKILSKTADLSEILKKDLRSIDVFSENEKGILLMMSLCDDLVFDDERSVIGIIFELFTINSKISNHRKYYLENYLGTKVEV